LIEIIHLDFLNEKKKSRFVILKSREEKNEK